MIKQGDLFIKTNISCKCTVKHVFTDIDFKYSIEQAKRIKNLILDNGWNLHLNYYAYVDKIDNNCNAWEINNSPYLTLRGNNQEKAHATIIPLARQSN